MSDSKHTPGPWKVEAAGIRVGEGFEPFGACGCCNSPWMMAKNEDTAEADARLIAAAPDMLAALQDAENLLTCRGGPTVDELNRCVASVRKAIAKAEGK